MRTALKENENEKKKRSAMHKKEKKKMYSDFAYCTLRKLSYVMLMLKANGNDGLLLSCSHPYIHIVRYSHVGSSRERVLETIFKHASLSLSLSPPLS